MLRFILKRNGLDNISTAKTSGHFTVDVDVPKLEATLRSGGFGENTYDFVELIGVEVLEDGAK